MKTKNNYGLVLIAAIFAIVSIGAGSKYASSRLPKEQETKIENKQKDKQENKEINKKFDVEELFQDSTHIFLNKNFSDEQLQEIEENLDNLSTTEKKLAVEAEKKWEIQKELNGLFDSPVLVGNDINSEAVSQKQLTQDEQVKLNQLIVSSGLNDVFIETVRNLVPTGDLVAVANEKIDVIVKNGEIVPTFTIEQYLEARDAISRVTQSEEKEKLLQKLAIVENELNAMGIDF